MIELVFDESLAGALKYIRKIKHGGNIKEHGIVAYISEDIVLVKLDLDIGDISRTQTDAVQRFDVLKQLYGDFPGVSETIWKTSEAGLRRLNTAKTSGEPIRIWAGEMSPADQCGLCFLCRLMEDGKAPLSVVSVPQQTERKEDNSLIEYRSAGEINPKDLVNLPADFEQPLSSILRMAYSRRWNELSLENAPLRAIVNGRLMSVGEDFYDFALNIPEGEFSLAKLIGLALGGLPGVSDRWLYMRVQAMLRSGELIEVSPATDDHPYSAVLRKKA